MDQISSLISTCALLWFILVLYNSLPAYGNAEGDALIALKIKLADPNNVLQSWDQTLVNPCTWYHVTCNLQNSVTRLDLGNANLTGQLVPQLGELAKLQYLELFGNKITGKIPNELGNLTKLVSLDLYMNRLKGHIPSTLGNLSETPLPSSPPQYLDRNYSIFPNQYNYTRSSMSIQFDIFSFFLSKRFIIQPFERTHAGQWLLCIIHTTEYNVFVILTAKFYFLSFSFYHNPGLIIPVYVPSPPSAAPAASIALPPAQAPAPQYS
ncbi:hypothetical protein LXL04_017049 [Taraxacum kok-saghyz]